MARRSDRPPPARPGWATCRSSSGRWTTASRRWCCPAAQRRSWSATCTTRSARSTSRRADRAWRTSSSTCSSRGPSGFPRVRSTGCVLLAAGQSNAETGEDSTHYWFAFPVRPLGAGAGNRGRPDARGAVRPARSRGRAARHRRGAAPATSTRRWGGSTRPTWPSPISATPTATRSWAGPTTWPGSAADDLRDFYQTHYRPDGAVLVVVGDVDPEAALDRIAAHFADVPGRASRLGRADDHRAAPDRPARLHARRLRIGSAGPAGLAHRRTRPSRRPGSRCARRPALRRPASRLWQALVETEQARHLGRDRARPRCTRGPVPDPGRGRAGRRPVRDRGRIIAEVLPIARRRPDSRRADAVAAPARGRLALGAGGPVGPGRRAGHLPRSGTTGGPGRPSTAARSTSRPRISAASSTVPDRFEPDGRLVAAQPSSRRRL